MLSTPLNYPGLVLGPPLENRNEVSSLAGRVKDGQIPAKKTEIQADGDVRYWDVDVSTSAVLQNLMHFAEAQFAHAAGRPPLTSLMMVNCTDARRCPNGSGGGWHRDSFRPQYKAFSYLTDVERESQGAFAFIPSSNSFVLRALSAARALWTGANRYDDSLIQSVERAGFASQPVLLPAGIPFFVNTSLVHRGLPISEGCRVMATVYMFESIPEWLKAYR